MEINNNLYHRRFSVMFWRKLIFVGKNNNISFFYSTLKNEKIKYGILKPELLLPRIKLSEIKYPTDVTRVTIYGRIHNIRLLSKNCFLVLRQNVETIQAIASIDEPNKDFFSSIKMESLVQITGTLKEIPKKKTSCSIDSLEIEVESIFLENEIKNEKFPFLVRSAENNRIINQDDRSVINLDTRLDHRVLDLRTRFNYSIFKIQSEISKYFRSHLENKNFIEIHTPKILSTASEGGGNVFKLKYFESNFLTIYFRRCISRTITSVIQTNDDMFRF